VEGKSSAAACWAELFVDGTAVGVQLCDPGDALKRAGRTHPVFEGFDDGNEVTQMLFAFPRFKRKDE